MTTSFKLREIQNGLSTLPSPGISDRSWSKIKKQSFFKISKDGFEYGSGTIQAQKDIQPKPDHTVKLMTETSLRIKKPMES